MIQGCCSCRGRRGGWSEKTKSSTGNKVLLLSRKKSKKKRRLKWKNETKYWVVAPVEEEEEVEVKKRNQVLGRRCCSCRGRSRRRRGGWSEETKSSTGLLLLSRKKSRKKRRLKWKSKIPLANALPIARFRHSSPPKALISKIARDTIVAENRFRPPSDRREASWLQRTSAFTVSGHYNGKKKRLPKICKLRYSRAIWQPSAHLQPSRKQRKNQAVAHGQTTRVQRAEAPHQAHKLPRIKIEESAKLKHRIGCIECAPGFTPRRPKTHPKPFTVAPAKWVIPSK